MVTFLLHTVTGAAMSTGVGLRIRGNEAQEDTGTALAILGGIPTLFLAIWDIVGAGRSAREARYREGRAAGLPHARGRGGGAVRVDPLRPLTQTRPIWRWPSLCANIPWCHRWFRSRRGYPAESER